MFQKELDELGSIAAKTEALITVLLDSCEKNDYTTQQIVLEEAQKYASILTERIVELNFSII